MYVLAWIIVIGMIVFALIIAAAITAAVAMLAGDETDVPAPVDQPGGPAAIPEPESAVDEPSSDRVGSA